jgi:hypothetical protein
MLLRRSFPLIVLLVLFVVGCSNSSNAPVVPPSGESLTEQVSDLRTLSVDQSQPENYWSVPIALEDKIWAGHYNENGTLHRAIGPGISVMDPIAFVDSNPEIFMVNSNNLTVMKDEYHDGIRYLIYNQTFNGIMVAKSRVDFRFARNGNLVLIGSDVFPYLNVTTSPSISALDAYDVLVSDVNAEQSPKFEDSKLVVYPDPQEGTLAWRIDAGNWRMYIDASSGRIIERIQNEWNAYTANVQNSVKLTSPYDSETSLPAAFNMVAYADGTGWFANTLGYGYADATGYSSFVGTISPAYAHAGMLSPWVNVNNASGTDGGIYGWVNDGSHNNYSWDDTNSALSERMTFYWINVGHDYVKDIDSTFTGLDIQIDGNANGYAMCNAMANESSVNFYQPADGCNDTGHIPDVILHEYGHVFTFHQYTQDVNVDVHEGCSDYFAATVTDQSVIGKDIQGPGTSFRNCENNVKYPASECGGEGHCTGQMLAGAFWDMRQALGRTYADYLFVYSRYGEPLTFQDFPPEVIILDDDNDNPLDGSANYNTIYQSFYTNHLLAVPAAPNFPTSGINVDLWPANPPVEKQRSTGGMIDYTVRLTNLNSTPTSFQVWAEIFVPWYGFYGPLIPPSERPHAPLYLTLQPGQVFQIPLRQYIPGPLPAGTYTYHVRVGTYHGTLIDDAWFDIKLVD